MLSVFIQYCCKLHAIRISVKHIIVIIYYRCITTAGTVDSSSVWRLAWQTRVKHIIAFDDNYVSTVLHYSTLMLFLLCYNRYKMP